MTDLLAHSDMREAKERASRIRLGITSYLTTLADIRSAWDRRDWATLGYEDWDTYLDGEFSETRLRVPAEHRAKAITELRMAGMSTRAIASAVKVSQATVARNVRDLSQMTQEVLPEKIRTLDGKDRPSSQPKPVKALPVKPELVSPHAAIGTAIAAPKPPALSVEDADEDQVLEPALPIPVSPSRPPFESNRAPEASLADEDAAVRSSAKVGESLATLFLALDPDPVRWAANRWRPNAFANRDLPRVRDAFTTEGLRQLGDHLYALAEHLEENGISL
jgi:hypothetical protein